MATENSDFSSSVNWMTYVDINSRNKGTAINQMIADDIGSSSHYD